MCATVTGSFVLVLRVIIADDEPVVQVVTDGG